MSRYLLLEQSDDGTWRGCIPMDPDAEPLTGWPLMQALLGLQAEVMESLRAEVLKYGDHLPLTHFAGGTCTCGFDAAIASAGRE